MAEKIAYKEIISDMKNDSSLKVGEIVQTLGYYEVGDGDGSLYLISDGQPVDEYGNHTLNNGKYTYAKCFRNLL